MNAKKIFNNIQQRIALDNFKVEAKRRRNTKRTMIAFGAIALILASLMAINSRKENKEI